MGEAAHLPSGTAGNRASVPVEPVRESALKRIFDFALAAVGLMFFSPLILIIAAAILLEEWGPVFYVQPRVGKGGRIFNFYKFRTMLRDADRMPVPENPDDDDPRVTRVGNILRITAMNELPQLINMLKGDMSFVGPRPEIPELAERWSREIPNYDLRHRVRPGLTGLAQLRASRNAHDRIKLKYDLFYIEKRTFCMDIAFLFRSLGRTILGRWDK
jgi:lipopolysaccharide/colanic/teichoic acid biosynthesis glycosyltransferase